MQADRSDLIQRAQRGDPAAFEALYRAHVGRVYALCLRLTADAARAEEFTQDAFVRAWERLASFRGESAFSSWLYRLTVNVVFLGQRASRRRGLRVFTTDDPAALERPRDGPGVPGGRGGAAGARRGSRGSPQEHRAGPGFVGSHRRAHRATCNAQRATGFLARSTRCRGDAGDRLRPLPSSTALYRP